jgi:hypothetical protein
MSMATWLWYGSSARAKPLPFRYDPRGIGGERLGGEKLMDCRPKLRSSIEFKI